eukprot:3214788-Prymnesium_polylepis.2
MERLKVDPALTKLQLVPELATEDLVRRELPLRRSSPKHTQPSFSGSPQLSRREPSSRRTKRRPLPCAPPSLAAHHHIATRLQPHTGARAPPRARLGLRVAHRHSLVGRHRAPRQPEAPPFRLRRAPPRQRHHDHVRQPAFRPMGEKVSGHACVRTCLVCCGLVA